MATKSHLVSYKTGILIISQHHETIHELRANKAWIELPAPTPLHLFASQDIAPELKIHGLPKSVQRRLAVQLRLV